MKRYIRTSETKAAIDAMKNNMQYQNSPSVGIFWYDVNNDELFGIKSTYADEASWYDSPQFNCKVRTERKLHQSYWEKEFYRGKDRRFLGDYTKVPRGRIFEFENEGFKVYTGSWIDKYPQVKQYIIDEFDLPKDNTEFVQDVHWDIGHGWSTEY